MACRGSLIVSLLVLVPACATDNPLFGTGILDAGDSEIAAEEDADAGDDDDDDDDDDASEELCTGSAPGGFGLSLQLEPQLCDGLVDWECWLDHSDSDWYLRDCCPSSSGCPDGPLPELFLDFEGRPLHEAFIGENVRFRAGLSATQPTCSARWVEIIASTAPIPLYAGATIPDPALESLAVDVRVPTVEERCACSTEDASCCDRPPGPYELAFNLPAFAGMFPGVTLSQGETHDEAIGNFGHPLIEVFTAFRNSGCNAELDVNWSLVLVGQ